MSAPGCGAGQVEGPVPAPRPAGASGPVAAAAPLLASPDSQPVALLAGPGPPLRDGSVIAPGSVRPAPFRTSALPRMPWMTAPT